MSDEHLQAGAPGSGRAARRGAPGRGGAGHEPWPSPDGGLAQAGEPGDDFPGLSAVGEAKVAARALLASAVATLVDGAVYNGLLWVQRGRYMGPAVAGAAFGAATNFLICRYWVYPPTNKRIDRQALQYLIGSALTYLALQAVLMACIEGAHMDPHLAWIPAKVVAWGAVSYPFSRFVAFRGHDAGEKAIDR